MVWMLTQDDQDKVWDFIHGVLATLLYVAHDASPGTADLERHTLFCRLLIDSLKKWPEMSWAGWTTNMIDTAPPNEGYLPGNAEDFEPWIVNYHAQWEQALQSRVDTETVSSERSLAWDFVTAIEDIRDYHRYELPEALKQIDQESMFHPPLEVFLEGKPESHTDLRAWSLQQIAVLDYLRDLFAEFDSTD